MGAIFEILYKKYMCVARAHFQSKKTEIANRVFALKILETLFKYIATF
jgi:hypothetical protein